MNVIASLKFYGKHQKDFEAHFDNLLSELRKYVNDFECVELHENKNEFTFLKHQVKFIPLWQDKWWSDHEIKVKIEVKKECYKLEAIECAKDELLYTFKPPIFFTIDRLGNIRVNGLAYSINEIDLKVALLNEICKVVGMNLE